ncbi:hypothetical protein [Arboricoccus pini]|uniref:hypothetical protein n=1 Tax=Arboricoccus pini TaxID=1963835 RepID=UPI000B511519|nr:hypothetical protein [Arboricoccus pini]
MLQGCTSLGPSSVLADRNSFGETSNESAKQELLLNLVRLRYGDTPSVVRINQLVAGYNLEGQVNIGSSLFSDGFSIRANDALSGGVTYSDHPTITYAPIRGADYGAFLMTPLAPSEILALIMSGAPGDVVITLGVQAINGLRNRFDSGLGHPQSDLGFRTAMYLIEQLGNAGKLGMRFENQGENRAAYFVFYDNGKDMDPAEQRLRKVLKLDPTRREFKVVFGLTPDHPDEIAFYTRSLIQTMNMIADSIEVPEDDISSGRTRPTEAPDPSDQALPALHITSQRLPPVNAFVSVRYRDRYFTVDDRDLASKRMFSMLQLLATISDRGRNDASPIITIPSG